MNCLKCGEEFKPRHKYHQFCSRTCKYRNYFGKERKETKKLFAPSRVKKTKSEFFDWKYYPNGV